MPRYKVFLEKKAQRQLERLDEKTRSRIVEALRLLGDRGFSARLDLKKLRGYKGQYRLRVGRHRVLFELQPEKTIIVHVILSRRRAYRS
ncbi:type II toxin-antitoxin system RelE/ParE family toxin [Candidatus Bathyarchaeota archaeon]|nr:type II toxin-antitoxin system RelE/ParE family toxin [Candidatus Bathyarchaeota archaeon]